MRFITGSNADERLFEAWIRDFAPDLFRHALWLTRDEELARELVQECFYQAWRHRRGLRDRSKARAWLITILRRAHYHSVHEKNLRFVSLDTCPEPGVDSIPLWQSSHDLRHAMSTLPLWQQEILLLRFLHDCAYQEIGDILDLPVGTVMSRLNRARTALRKALGEELLDNLQAACASGSNVIWLTPEETADE